MESQINPTTGEFPEKTAQEVYEEYLKAKPKLKSRNFDNWTSLGTNSSTGGYAGVGRINCIAFHPSDNNTYWVGAASGGLWVTTNNGSSWTCLTDNNGVLAVSDIVIPTDYVTTNTIYIATGDRDAWDNRSIGVLKSTNNGSTWNSTGISFALSDGDMVNRLLLDPNNNQIIIAATTNGVYKTTNGGTTWSTQLTSTAFIDMEYKPGDFNTLYGSTQNGGIYVSTNGGTGWTQAFSDANAYRIELAVSVNQPAWVYAIAANAGNGLYGVYRSTDSGTSFTQVLAGTTRNLLGLYEGVPGSDDGGLGWYDLSIVVSLSDANLVLVGGVNTWRSTDGGTNWTMVNHWYGGFGAQAVHADKHMLKYRNNGDLFECNDGGVYISNNNGTFWTDKTNGMVISQMYKLGVSETVSTEVITGLQDNGTKLLSGGSWYDVYGGDGMECLIDYTDVNVQYGTYVYGQIIRTTDQWDNYTDISPSGAGTGAWVTPYIIDPANNQTLYAGYADIWKTTNRGNSWTQISTINSSAKIRSMAIAPSNTQVLYVADPYTIWKTTNGGTLWTDITGTLPVSSGNITYIAVKNNYADTLWVTMGGYNANKVYQSIDGGTSWTDISTGLPQIPAYTIVQNKQSTTEVQLYVGTELGIYFKKGSDNWVAYNTGLPNVKIGEIEIYYAANPQESKLRAATYGRGLWESPVYFVCTSPTPTAPTVGTITQPSCFPATGSVELNGLPATGTWTLTRTPGGTTTTGTGTSTTISGLAAGIYTYTVTNAAGCTSVASNHVVINAYPATPTTPTVGTITQPTCAVATGSVELNGLPATGTWTINPDSITGIGIITTITGLAAGTYTYTVTNASGCISVASANVVINSQPQPATPIITLNGNILHSDASNGNQWYNTSGLITGATDSIYVPLITENYFVIVTDSNGCVSDSSNLIYVIITGLASNASSNNFIRIYPNPANDRVIIEFPVYSTKNKTTVTILGLDGKLLKSLQIKRSKTQINISDLSAGVYIIKVTDNKGVAVKRFVKE